MASLRHIMHGALSGAAAVAVPAALAEHESRIQAKRDAVLEQYAQGREERGYAHDETMETRRQEGAQTLQSQQQEFQAGEGEKDRAVERERIGIDKERLGIEAKRLNISEQQLAIEARKADAVIRQADQDIKKGALELKQSEELQELLDAYDKADTVEKRVRIAQNILVRQGKDPLERFKFFTSGDPITGINVIRGDPYTGEATDVSGGGAGILTGAGSENPGPLDLSTLTTEEAVMDAARTGKLTREQFKQRMMELRGESTGDDDTKPTPRGGLIRQVM